MNKMFLFEQALLSGASEDEAEYIYELLSNFSYDMDQKILNSKSIDENHLMYIFLKISLKKEYHDILLHDFSYKD